MAGKKKFPKLTKRGSIMALVLFAIVLLLLSGVGVLSIGQTARIFSIRTSAEIAAFSAADTGITKAVWAINTKLQTGGTWDKHYLEEVDFVRSASWKEGDYVIRSFGACGAARKVIYAIVGLEGPCDTGVLVRDSITLKAGTLVDGRDSSDPTNLDVEVEIGTLSTDPDKVILNNGVTVDGNILVGIGGDPSTVIKDLGAETGIHYPMTEQPDLPYIYPPAGLTDWREAIEAKGDTVSFTAANSGIYTGIDLTQLGIDKPGILEITSGDVVLHITGDINMGVRCEIIIQDGATLNLYVDGDIGAGTESGFKNYGTPPSLKIWGNWRGGVEVEQDWQLNAKSTCFGQIYAPAADVTINNSGDLFGAFTANSFLMMNDGNLFYDGALRDVNADDEGVRFVLKRWYER